MGKIVYWSVDCGGLQIIVLFCLVLLVEIKIIRGWFDQCVDSVDLGLNEETTQGSEFFNET